MAVCRFNDLSMALKYWLSSFQTALMILQSQKSRIFYGTSVERLHFFQIGTTFYLCIVHYLVFYTEKPLIRMYGY